MDKKIKLSFMNKGKEFIIPRMTVEKQEEIMEKIVELEKTNKKTAEKRADRYLVISTLQQIDPKVTEKNVLQMHPEDFIKLFGLIWDSGREITSDASNFREKI